MGILRDFFCGEICRFFNINLFCSFHLFLPFFSFSLMDHFPSEVSRHGNSEKIYLSVIPSIFQHQIFFSRKERL